MKHDKNVTFFLLIIIFILLYFFVNIALKSVWGFMTWFSCLDFTISNTVMHIDVFTEI